MDMILSGRVWKFGDNLRSNYFLSGKYDPLGRAGKFKELSRHVLEDVYPTFCDNVKFGDIFVVGEAFGTGKHLDGPINAFKYLGISAVLGKSFSANWERDSINLGLPALVYPELFSHVDNGDVIEIDLRAKYAKNISSGIDFPVQRTHDGILKIIEAGGISEYTAKRIGIKENTPKLNNH